MLFKLGMGRPDLVLDAILQHVASWGDRRPHAAIQQTMPRGVKVDAPDVEGALRHGLKTHRANDLELRDSTAFNADLGAGTFPVHLSNPVRNYTQITPIIIAKGDRRETALNPAQMPASRADRISCWTTADAAREAGLLGTIAKADCALWRQSLAAHSTRVGLTQDLFAAGEDLAGIMQALRSRASAGRIREKGGVTLPYIIRKSEADRFSEGWSWAISTARRCPSPSPS